MRQFTSIPRFWVSFMKSQKDLQLKDPLKELKVSVAEMQQKAKRTQIYRTQTGYVPISILDKWQGTKEMTIAEKKIDIPYNFEGIDSVPDEMNSFLGENIFLSSRVRKQKLFDHLIKIYKGPSIHFQQSYKDKEFLLEYSEKRFAERVLESIKGFSQKGDELIAFEDVTGDKGEPIPYKCHQVEIALIRGLSVEREQNLDANEYHIWRDIDDMGIVGYTPIKVTDPENFIDPKTNANMYNNFQLMAMRVLVRIQSPLRLKILKANGQVVVTDSDNYSYNHLAIFETQLIAPEKFESGYRLENYQQWLNKFNTGTWKLVDIDNWMDGNQMIVRGNEKESYADEIFAGSDFDSKCLIDIRRV